MACTALTRGRNLDCNRISGGIKAVYFAVLDQITSITYDTTAAPNQVREIDDIDIGSNSVYRYILPMGASSLTDTIVGSRENGTIYYTPTINIIYNNLQYFPLLYKKGGFNKELKVINVTLNTETG